jgi:hypothetical protein
LAQNRCSPCLAPRLLDLELRGVTAHVPPHAVSEHSLPPPLGLPMVSLELCASRLAVL